ncbi:hypothetical protein EON65_32060 [archaeon]|nr:MAG: hypothetical protein EON65_32060 [archaeon]
MYIGPWQEYNLSKARVRPSAVANTRIKNDLEESLAKTLDPLAAQAAIAAVETFFNAQQQSTSSQTTTLHPLVIPANTNVPKRPTQRLPPRHARAGRRHLPSLHNRVVQSAQDMLQSSDSTHTIFTDSSTPAHTPDSRRQGNDVITPLSVRSTQSEPMPTRLPLINSHINVKPMFSPHKNHMPSTILNPHPNLHPSSLHLPSLHDAHNSSSVTSGYNANAVVSMLKLQKRQAISRVTGWDAASSSVDMVLESVENDGLKAKRKLDPIDRDKEKKLEHINSMRQAYMQSSDQHTDALDTQTQTHTQALTHTFTNKLRSSGTRMTDSAGWDDDIDSLPAIKVENSLLEMPATPKIQAINLTSDELKLVSKYFASNDAGMNSASHHIQQMTAMGTRPVGVAFSSATSLSSLYGPDQATPMTANSSRTQHTTYDELHVSGIDGLLKWSSQLDLDNL